MVVELLKFWKRVQALPSRLCGGPLGPACASAVVFARRFHHANDRSTLHGGAAPQHRPHVAVGGLHDRSLVILIPAKKCFCYIYPVYPSMVRRERFHTFRFFSIWTKHRHTPTHCCCQWCWWESEGNVFVFVWFFLADSWVIMGLK